METAVKPFLQRLWRMRRSPFVARRCLTQNARAQETPARGSRSRPFIRSLFSGEINAELLTFPDVLSAQDVGQLDSGLARKIADVMTEKVNSVQIDQKQEIPDAVFQHLKSLGLFGRMMPAKYGGLELTHTACVRLNEVLGFDWAVSSALSAHEFFAAQVILKFGSDEQKSLYLPELSSGNLVAALCCAELGSGSDLLGLETKATETSEGSFAINGTKSWVSNAQAAGIFVVFAKTTNPTDPRTSDISVFLVEKGRKGVKVVPQTKTGLRGLDTGHVCFEEVVVPSSNIIGVLGNGFEVYLKALESFRIASSTFTFGALKSLLGCVTKSVIDQQRTDRSLADYNMLRLSRVCALIYGMESLSYYAAATLDSTGDTAMEAAALKVFNSEGTLSCVRDLMEVVGASSLLPDAHLERFHRDARALSMMDSPNDLCRLHLGLTACRTTGRTKQHFITQVRNPFMFPKERIKRIYVEWKLQQRRFRLDRGIGGRVHPALKEWGNEFEGKVQMFEFAMEDLVIQHGRGVVSAQVGPVRLGSVASELYAWLAVLARASRGATPGHEIQLAAAYSHDANDRIWVHLHSMLTDGRWNNDRSHAFLGEHVVRCGGYFAEHPLTHNF